MVSANPGKLILGTGEWPIVTARFMSGRTTVASGVSLFDGGVMKYLMVVCALIAYTTVAADQYSGVSYAMAARVEAQAWRVDQLTERFQAITVKVDGARTAAKAGGDMARHIMHNHMSGKKIN